MPKCDSSKLHEPSKSPPFQYRIEEQGPDRLNVSEDGFIGSLTFHGFSVGLAGCFTLAAGLLSFYLMFRHATNYTCPGEQRLYYSNSPHRRKSIALTLRPNSILRILLMVPIYSIACRLSIKFYQHHTYFEAIHQLYEALVLASFFMLLCRYLAPDHRSLKEKFKTVTPRPWMPPIAWLAMCTGGQRGPFRTPSNGLTFLNVLIPYIKSENTTPLTVYRSSGCSSSSTASSSSSRPS